MDATRDTCITELSPLGILRFSGPDAQTFLQGQITSNVNELNSTKSNLATHCNLKGRMQSLFRIFLSQKEDQNNYYLVMPASIIASAFQAFKKYALFSKVKIEDMTSQSKGLGISGVSAEQILALNCDIETLSLHENDTFTDFLEGDLYGICRSSGLLPRFEVYGPSAQIESLHSKLSPLCSIQSAEYWELEDIQAGLPCVYPQTQEQLLPHHVNLVELKGISFDKGCYLGQEIIARMHYRGNIKKHMHHAFVYEADIAPEPGDPIYIEGSSTSEAPGVVVRAARSENGFELLVVIDDQYADFEKAHLVSIDGPKLNK